MGRPHEEPRLHDMGGEIGAADVARDPDPRRSVEPAASPDPEALAVDALPDDARTGMQHQDETSAVQETGGEIRHVDDDR